MNHAAYAAKGTLKFSTGLFASILFVSNMDDFIYNDFKKNIIQPLQMVSVKGKYEMDDAKKVASGTGKFLKSFQPHGLEVQGAKDLLLKDAEYSTPQDHYFAHLASAKEALENQENEMQKAREAQVMQIIFDADENEVSAVELAINKTAQMYREKEKTFSQMVRGLNEEELQVLLKQTGLT